jgi:hypothetical protein
MSDSFTGFGKFSDLAKSDQAAAEHATGFEPPIYNIWKWREGKFHNLFTIPAWKVRFSPLS